MPRTLDAESLRRELAAANAARALGEEVLSKPAVPNALIKYTTAKRCFETAAEAFIMCGRWREAGRAYGSCGDAEKAMGNELQAASYFVEAGECAGKVDHLLAVPLYTNATACFVAKGRFKAAAAMQRRVARMHAEDGADSDAARAFAYTAELFLGADDAAQAALHFWDAGRHYVLARAFADASAVFERAAGAADDAPMQRYLRPQMFLDAGLALLGAGDVHAAETCMLRCAGADPIFAGGRELRLLRHIVGCIKRLDVDAFMDHCWNYDYAVELEPHQLKYVCERKRVAIVRRVTTAATAATALSRPFVRCCRILERLHTMFKAELEDQRLRMAKEADAIKRFGQRRLAIDRSADGKEAV